jgi:tRNA(fMet)-specific endonuclease VapC
MEEMYLFDTDTITNILKKNPSKKLINKIYGINREDQFISTITVGEIIYGAFKSRDPAYRIEQLKKVLLPLVNVLSFGSGAEFYYGKIRAELEKQGEIISGMDLQVAPIAIANDLKLITGNTRHFKRIKILQIEDWIN